MEGKYKFSASAPKHIVNVLDPKTNLYIPTEVVGVTPFGKHTGVLTENKLSDTVAEYLIGKSSVNEPYANWIVLKDKK